MNARQYNAALKEQYTQTLMLQSARATCVTRRRATCPRTFVTTDDADAFTLMPCALRRFSESVDLHYKAYTDNNWARLDAVRTDNCVGRQNWTVFATCV